MTDKPVLVTGATGYVGGRLVPLLLDKGYTVRAAGRSEEKIRCRPWGGHENLQVAVADLQDRDSMVEACRGCSAAFYLVHSMSAKVADFAAADRAAAYNMVRAANETGLPRIIYLGGLGEEGDDLSEHLKSRAETATILSLSSAELTVLRAAVILGAGSASFEILRYLTERLPVMTTPRWVRTRSQPIAISDVLGYLAGCLEHPETAGRAFDIGGPDVMTYEELFQLYARVAGLRKRLIIPVPVLTPGLSAYWLNFVTPVPMALARPLVEGLKNEVVVKDDAITRIIPQDLLSCEKALARAAQKLGQKTTPTCWHDAGEVRPPEWTRCGDPSYAGGKELQCGYQVIIEGAPEDVWPTVEAVGGNTGWYGGDALWRLRGLADKLVGGPGLRRGRRDPEHLQPGDAVDFWRVLEVDAPRKLLLHAEMKLPGEALLEFHLEPSGETTQLTMLSRFLPRGLAGLAYWYSVYPLHHLVFAGMLRGMARAARGRVLEKPTRYTPVFRNACRAMFK